MKVKFAAVALLATALVTAPLAPAHADGWHHHGGYYHGGGGLLFGLGAAVGAVAGAAVTIVAAPFNAIAYAGAPAPAPVYVAPTPQPYYGYAQPVYQPRQVVVYRYAQPTYPAYYAY